MIRRIFASMLGLLLAFTPGCVQAEGGSAERESAPHIDASDAAPAGDGAGSAVLQALDLETGKMVELSDPDGDVLSWEEFFHQYGQETVEMLEFADEDAFDELFSEMFIVQQRLEDADGKVLEEINLFEPSGYGDPVYTYGWDQKYRNVALKGYDEAHVDAYTIRYDGVVAVGPAQINREIYVCDGPLHEEADAGSAPQGEEEAGDGNAMKLTDEEQYQLNKFLSNFAVANFCRSWVRDEARGEYVPVPGKFSVEAYDADALVDFAWKYIHIRLLEDPASLHEGNYYYWGYRLEAINDVLMRFFGIQVKEEEIPGGEFLQNAGYTRIVREGYVYMPAGDGESYWNLAIARDVKLISDDQAHVNFDVYYINDQEIAPVGDIIRDDSVYHATAEEAENRNSFVDQYSGSAVIRFEGDLRKRKNFTLVEYILDGAAGNGENAASDAAEDAAEPSAAGKGEAADDLFAQIPSRFTFSSGMGGWWTEITIAPDGSFRGLHTDTNAGESGPGYDMTESRSEFSGQFIHPKRVDEYSWSFELGSLNYDTPVGESEIGSDGGMDKKIHYVDAYGLEGGKNFLLYAPGTPTAMLPPELIDWAYSIADGSELRGYCIYNVEGQYGFVAAEG